MIADKKRWLRAADMWKNLADEAEGLPMTETGTLDIIASVHDDEAS